MVSADLSQALDQLAQRGLAGGFAPQDVGQLDGFSALLPEAHVATRTGPHLHLMAVEAQRDDDKGAAAQGARLGHVRLIGTQR